MTCLAASSTSPGFPRGTWRTTPGWGSGGWARAASAPPAAPVEDGGARHAKEREPEHRVPLPVLRVREPAARGRPHLGRVEASVRPGRHVCRRDERSARPPRARVCDRSGDAGGVRRRATVIREEERARRDADRARFRGSIVPTARDRATKRRDCLAYGRVSRSGPRGTDERAGAAAIEARDGRETAGTQKTHLGTRRRVVDDARVSCTRREVAREARGDEEGVE